MQTILDKNDLYTQIRRKAILISPNNRLSGKVIKDFYFHQGNTTLAKPCCLPHNNFIKKLFQDNLSFFHKAPPMLLSQLQTRHLWHNLLLKQDNLTNSSGLLKTVMDAWTHCIQWNISPNNSAFTLSHQTELFSKWWKSFNEELEKKHFITEQELPSYIIKDDLYTDIHQPIIWACFDSFTPQQILFQEKLAHQGIEQYLYDLTEIESKNSIYAAEDPETECQQLLLWLKKRVGLGDRKIAVVVPDLEEKHRWLSRQIGQHFEKSDVNISLGQSLSSYPLVSHALNWLKLDAKEINHHQLRLLLHSPFVKGSQSEFKRRAEFWQNSSLLKKKSLPLKELKQALIKSCPILTEALEAIKDYPDKAQQEQWLQLFFNRLNEMGFPGEYSIDSHTYQCFQRFRELFVGFQQLGLINEELNKEEALSAIADLAKQAVFQPKSDETRIQVLGLLEASGLEFDSQWLMGLTDECLPAKAKLSPFIPHNLQKEEQMPHSTPERELELAEKMIGRFKKASPVNVFSYPKINGECPKLPSPLITDLTRYEVLESPNTEEPQREYVKDSYQIPLKYSENISGGTFILADQAKCPFRAFAAHRLKAKATPQLIDGIDPMEKGQLIHKVMENIWRVIQNQQELLSLTESQLDEIISQAITEALSPLHINKSQSFSSLIQQIEFTRLKRIVLECLDWEKSRPPFQVEAIEKKYELKIGSLNFNLRVDRLDKTSDNKKWIIDYKSTIPAGKPWDEDRPKEPQLLLYALLDESIRTLMFIQLKSGQVETKSFSEDKLEFSKASTVKKGQSWSDYRDYWKKQLNALADEFTNGYCPPQPINASVCSFCDFQNLCRIHQMNKE